MKSFKEEMSLEYLLPKSSPTLGDGYQKAIRHFAANQGIEYTVRKNQQEIQNPITFINIEYVLNLKDTTIALMGDIKVSASTLASAQMKQSAEFMDSQRMLYAVITIYQKSKEEHLSNVTLAAAKEVIQKKEANLYYHKFGNKYVSSITRGKKMIFVLQLSDHKESRRVSLVGKLNFNKEFVEIKSMGKFLYEHLKEAKIINKNIYTLGVSTPPVDFDDIKQLNERIKEYLESKEEGIIDYSTEPYSMVNDFKSEDIGVNEEIQAIDEDIEKILARVKQLEENFNEIIDSVANLNPRVINADDLSNKEFVNLKEVMKGYTKQLKYIKVQIMEERKIYKTQVYDEYSKTIQVAETWFDKNKDTLMILSNHTLLSRIELSKTKYAIEFSVPLEIQGKTRYFFLKFENPNPPSFGIFTTKMKLRKVAVLKADIPEKGAYVHANIELLKHLSVAIKDIGFGDDRLILNIYASSATKELIIRRGYNIIEIKPEFASYMAKQAIKRQARDVRSIMNMPALFPAVAMIGSIITAPALFLSTAIRGREMSKQIKEFYRLACSINRSAYCDSVVSYLKSPRFKFSDQSQLAKEEKTESSSPLSSLSP